MKKILLVLLLISPSVMAGDPHHSHNTGTVVMLADNTFGAASAAAQAQHHPYYGTRKLQGSFGLGSFEGEYATSVGLAQQLGAGKVMMNGTATQERGKISYGIGANWKF